jgi:glycosyltransferase involved in cell wall biosynthesis
MHLGKAFVITDSAGIRDYVQDESNALTVEPGSVDAMAAAVRRLWADPDLCRRLGETGRAFAARECKEARIAEHFLGWLRTKKLVEDDPDDSR